MKRFPVLVIVLVLIAAAVIACGLLDVFGDGDNTESPAVTTTDATTPGASTPGATTPAATPAVTNPDGSYDIWTDDF